MLAVLGGWLVARGHGFWYDELYTAEVAPLPLTRLLDAVLTGEGTIPYLADAPPSYNAPYYAVAHVWLTLTGLGPDEVGLRLLSLVSAVAAVAVFTRAVRRLAGPRVAVVAGVVLAANPFVVRYAAEARGYALALLATALAVLGVARWLDSASGRDLLLFGVAGAAAGLAHWFAVLVPLALAVAAVVLRGRRAVPVVALAVAAASPVLGLVGVAVGNGVGGSGAEWIADVGLAVPWLTLRAWTGGNPVLLVATVATAAVAVVTGRRGGSRPAVVAGLWAALPVAAVTALEMVRPVFVA
ncbi:MAG: glycosyltransferase family 39 protein, partial [Actinomycetota bacterium]|nr:glycosyltransferase family 39 protein [Actinomycetota bacterium]